MGEDDATGGVYECTEAMFIKATGNPGGRTALMSEAGDQDPGMGHGISECCKLLGPRRADNSTDCTVLLITGCFNGLRLYTFGDMIVDMALVNFEVLKIFSTGV